MSYEFVEGITEWTTRVTYILITRILHNSISNKHRSTTLLRNTPKRNEIGTQRLGTSPSCKFAKNKNIVMTHSGDARARNCSLEDGERARRYQIFS